MRILKTEGWVGRVYFRQKDGWTARILKAEGWVDRVYFRQKDRWTVCVLKTDEGWRGGWTPTSSKHGRLDPIRLPLRRTRVTYAMPLAGAS